MKLVAIAALIAVCGAAKLDRTYLPPASAATAGGNSDSLQTPLFKTSNQASSSESTGPLPTGSYTNNFQGVVVDAAGPGTRASPEGNLSGLGGSRDSYGSENSKVGDAAFRGSVAGFRTPFGSVGFGGQNGFSNNLNQQSGQSFGIENKSERPQAFKDRNSNILSYANDVNVDNYSYGFETDNGIAIGENGVAINGIQAQGGYSYRGDDGQVYKVTYVADAGGYRPQGDHLPTPPPIPKEILASLEQNAKEEAAGLVDDGSYDAQKYNAEGDYTHHNDGNIQYNGAQSSPFAKRPGSDATASSSFINQNNQAFGTPGQFVNAAAQNTQPNFNEQGQSNQFSANIGPNTLPASSHQESGQSFNVQPNAPSYSIGQYEQSSNSQLGQLGGFGLGPHASSQINQQLPSGQIGTQNAQYNSQATTSQQRPQSGLSSAHATQTNQQSGTNQIDDKPNQIQSSTLFGSQSNIPSSVNSYQNQINSQAFKPQGALGPEYLPPFNVNDRPSFVKPISNELPLSQDTGKNQSNPEVINQTSGNPTFNTIGQTVNELQNQAPKQPQINYYDQTNQFSSASQYNGSPFSAAPVAAKPTSIPSTELTTPLEPNEKQTFSQNSQGHSQTQVQSQNNIADSRPQGSNQFASSSSGFGVKQQPQSFDSQNQQNNAYYTTQKPLNQDSDYSYYYNQPSKPFSQTRPQFTRPQSTSINGISSQFTNQQGSQLSINQFPTSIAPVSPTSSSQPTQLQESYSSNYNGVTQAAISPFPSVSSATSTQYYSTQTNQFPQSSESKPNNVLANNPSSSVFQTQSHFTTNTNEGVSVGQTFGSNLNPVGQTDSTFTTQNQFNQGSNTNELVNQGPITETQQYNGTLYEYNKPPEVLPASEESDSSSSQSIQTDSSKPQNQDSSNQNIIPQLGSLPNSFGINSFSSQNQSTLSPSSKPQFGSQSSKPFSQNSQSSFNQQSQVPQVKPKPNESSFSSSSQFGQSSSTFGSRPQFGNQPANPFGSTSNSSQYNQNIQQQTQQVQSGVQPFQPFGARPTNNQFGQNSQSFEAQNSNPQLNVQQSTFNGNGLGSQFGNRFPTQSTQTFGANSNYQGYPSSKPQPGSQLQLPTNQFAQNSKQTFSTSQSNSLPATQVSGIPTETPRPNFGQNPFLNQPTLFGQQPVQGNQYGQSANPQYGTQAQYGQNQNTGANNFGSASSQAQVGPNSAEASSSALGQPSAYKPFASSIGNSQNQASQSFSTTVTPLQFNAQQFGQQNQGSQSQSAGPKVPCCKSTPGSAIAPVNVGQPSQVFAQTQSQFSGFQGALGFNAQTLAGKGEQFDGSRQPPSFDATGYHY